ncbi:hypothetical protein JTE90_012878 [Oedothorax gibbosus]|uniref:Uncharacterized protein n=1 Tax=Oedothorax gibbosus TaxID=931172 RepID=A0AAV6U873_9ARAC|nr:hypothetical protein JTE90_012878 [Oedothorax gibbosus]
MSLARQAKSSFTNWQIAQCANLLGHGQIGYCMGVTGLGPSRAFRIIMKKKNRREKKDENNRNPFLLEAIQNR